jgi:hypothetical protein
MIWRKGFPLKWCLSRSWWAWDGRSTRYHTAARRQSTPVRKRTILTSQHLNFAAVKNRKIFQKIRFGKENMVGTLFIFKVTLLEKELLKSKSSNHKNDKTTVHFLLGTTKGMAI